MKYPHILYLIIQKRNYHFKMFAKDRLKNEAPRQICQDNSLFKPKQII